VIRPPRSRCSLTAPPSSVTAASIMRPRLHRDSSPASLLCRFEPSPPLPSIPTTSSQHRDAALCPANRAHARRPSSHPSNSAAVAASIQAQ
jgi:hypothetical protein